MTITARDLRGRVAVYTRVSTDEQAKKDEGSLDNQLHRSRQYLSSVGHPHDVVDTARIYREEGYSGKDTNRPELQRLMRDIRAGRVGLLVFTELSRVSRSVEDFLAFAKLLQANKVDFISLRERFDTSSPQGNLIIVILVALYQFERETTSIRTKLAMRDRAERGLFNGGPIPLGYEPTPGLSGQLRIVEDEALMVREAYRVYLETGSLADTVRMLSTAGFKRPERTSRRGHARHGLPLSWSALAHVLRNPTYLGLKEVNGHRKELPDEEALALPESERYRLVDAVWEPLIDAESFERAGELLVENRARAGNAVGPKQFDYVLTGIIRCGDCGQVLEGASVRKKVASGDFSYYHYYRHDGAKPKSCTMQHGVHAERVEEAVLGRLRRLADDDRLLADLVERANQRIEDDVPERAKELANAREQVNRLHAEHQAMVERLMAAPAGMVPASFWEKAKGLEEQKHATAAVVSRLEVAILDTRSQRLDAETYRAALRRFHEIYAELDALQKADLLAYLLDDVTITGAEMMIALVGDPDAGRLDAFAADPQLGQTLEWLPFVDGVRTMCLRPSAETRVQMQVLEGAAL